jgi:hypothetical protein
VTSIGPPARSAADLPSSHPRAVGSGNETVDRRFEFATRQPDVVQFAITKLGKALQGGPAVVIACNPMRPMVD